jgi:hypothetical protein
MDPINYSISAQNPMQSFMQGLQSGAAVDQLQQQRQQQEAAKAAQMQMNTDLYNLSKNPTTEGIIQATIKYPQL